jgi:hypothetical protein
MKQNIDFTIIGGFKSAVARKAVPIAALGFLGALGFIPGRERLFGFTGFFGFIGAAYIVEAIHRARNRDASS